MEAKDFINVEMKELRKPLLGKTITVNTLDGKSIKGVLKRADENLLGIEHNTGFLIIFTKAIASIFMSIDDASEIVEP